MKTREYKNCIILLNCRFMGLKWESYCSGRFIYADTLAGIKWLITETIEESESC